MSTSNTDELQEIINMCDYKTHNYYKVDDSDAERELDPSMNLSSAWPT